MTPEEFKEEMIRLRGSDDNGRYHDYIDKETRHFNMDMLMVKTLRGSWMRRRN